MPQNLLLVEDQQPIATIVAEILSEVGMDVAAVASSVAEARHHIWDGRFEAALLEPEVGGAKTFAVADWLTANRTPVVFLTQPGSNSLPARFRNQLLVEKPFQPRTLVLQLARAMGVFAPAPALPNEPTSEFDAQLWLADSEKRLARLELLVARYPTEGGTTLIRLLRQTHGLGQRRFEVVRQLTSLGVRTR